MYIGYPTAIIDFWKDIKINDNDQIYATKVCNKYNNIIIDKNHKLFYNFYHNNNIQITNNKLQINNEFPNFISAPVEYNINHLLSNLGFINLPKCEKKSYNFYKLSNWQNEIILIIISIIIFLISSNNKINFNICYILFLELIHYELLLKHLEFKYIYIFIDIIYLLLNYLILYLYFNHECNKNKLFLLNIFYLFILFFNYNNLLYINNSIFNKINYFIDNDYKYKDNKDNKINSNTIENKILLLIGIIIILVINYKCLIINI